MISEIQARYKNVSRSGFSAKELGKTEIARLHMIENLIPESSQTILDAGCGEGIITNPLFQSGRDVLGIDISYPSLKFLESKKIQSSIDQLPFADNSFDLVLSSSVLEHLPEELLILIANELARVSREHILISTPYKEILWKALTKCPRCESIYHANLHLQSFDEKDLAKLFPECSIEKVEYGAPENWKLGPLVWIAQHIFNRYVFSRHAIKCPVCGLVFSNRSLEKTIESNNASIKVTIGKSINYLLQKVLWFRTERPTHIAILLNKSSNLENPLLKLK